MREGLWRSAIWEFIAQAASTATAERKLERRVRNNLFRAIYDEEDNHPLKMSLNHLRVNQFRLRDKAAGRQTWEDERFCVYF